jgi:pimeloyl-ACP methyl ester carboxylesterase
VSWGEKLSHDIPGARRLEILDAGHLVMEERTAEFARFVSDFLSRAAAASPPPGVEARS